MASIQSLTILDSVAGTATAVTDVALAPGETFQGSRKPDFLPGPGEGVAPVDVAAAGPTPVSGGQAYVLTFPSPILNQASGGLWYVRTIAGGSAVSDVQAIWMDPSLIGTYCMAGRALRDIVMANKPGLDLWLQVVDDKLSLQKSVFGADWNTGAATPGVLIKPYSCRATYEQVPRGRLTIMSFAVTAIIRASDAPSEAEAICQFVEGLERILNQACYESYQFEDGTATNGGHAEDYQFSDDIIEDVFASEGTFVWSWEYIRYTA